MHQTTPTAAVATVTVMIMTGTYCKLAVTIVLINSF